jgi:hypothetical protein
MGAPLVDGDVVVVVGVVVDVVVCSEADGAVLVTVVVDGGGAASGLRGSEPLPPVMTIAPASTAARANMAIVPTNNATWVLPKRDRPIGAAGDGTGGYGT